MRLSDEYSNQTYYLGYILHTGLNMRLTEMRLTVLKELIIPFFYPLGIKSYELEKWIKLVDIFYNKKHISKDYNSKNFILEFAKITKELNFRRLNNKKQIRIDIIINWLNNLNSFPSKDDKLNLIKLIKNDSD